MSYLVLPWALLSLTIGIANRITRIAIGTLTPRHQRHDAYSVRMPPSTRPIAAPPPAMPPTTLNALARSLGSVNVTVIRASAAGASSAANAPCRARAANSSSALPARPPSADANANPPRPISSVRLRPA